MARLLIISAASGRKEGNSLFLDVKFVEGMSFYCKYWDDEVCCMIPHSNNKTLFGALFDAKNLPFSVEFIPSYSEITYDQIALHDVILCDGDSHSYLHISEIAEKKPNKIIYVIEYTLNTRLRILFLEKKLSFLRKIYSLLWILNQERRRKKAFKAADGLQANGFPAFSRYKSLNRNTLLYLDNRLGHEMLPSESEISTREMKIKTGQTVRFLVSGRLERMKGAQDIIPFCRFLHDRSANFSLDIFGGGSLENEIKVGITDFGLQEKVHFHGLVDFETQLVPFAKRESDIFLSLNQQADPSCTYIESMGCGLPILGYSNEMWRRLLEASNAGWIAPLGDWMALAQLADKIIGDRDDIIEKSRNAFTYASEHCFENEFVKRVGHLTA